MVPVAANGLPVLGRIGTATAGTTQTQVGATALDPAKSFYKVTTGNANDGVALPDSKPATCVAGCIIVQNLSAVALKVYPFYDTVLAAGGGGTVNGAGANVAFAQPASSTVLYSLDSKDTWVSIQLS